MDSILSIIYANRNRDLNRIKITLDTLKSQSVKNFEVLFVDYGSDPYLVEKLSSLLNKYEFVRFFSLKVSQLLWNKSKALNYGILHAHSKFIFIADVDLVFHANATLLFDKLRNENKFFLFSMGYLDREESVKLTKSYNFEDLKPSKIGDVNGMILAPKNAFLEVKGLDEFYHFYGSEDEDLFARIELAGYQRVSNDSLYFYHNWHQSFASSEDDIITRNPRVKNIMRINQRHFFYNRDLGVIEPRRQLEMGKVINEEQSDLLKEPTKKIKIYNILSHVVHFLGEELPTYHGEIVKVVFVEDPYFSTLKRKVKKLMGKETQPYCSLKHVNDMVIMEILFRYRDYNYSFEISEDLKSIIFCVKL